MRIRIVQEDDVERLEEERRRRQEQEKNINEPISYDDRYDGKSIDEKLYIKKKEYLGKIKPSARGEYELQDAMQELIENDGDVYGLLLPNRIDLTHPVDLLRLNLLFLVKDPTQTEIHPDDIGNGTRFIDPVIIDKDVTIGSDCIIGPNVYIESGAIIGDGVNLENSVVLRESKVRSGTKVREEVIW